jgi:hypothetical protein
MNEWSASRLGRFTPRERASGEFNYIMFIKTDKRVPEHRVVCLPYYRMAHTGAFGSIMILLAV